jgi:hypothetical protein
MGLRQNEIEHAKRKTKEYNGQPLPSPQRNPGAMTPKYRFALLETWSILRNQRLSKLSSVIMCNYDPQHGILRNSQPPV